MRPFPLWESLQRSSLARKTDDRLARAKRLGFGGISSLTGVVRFDRPGAGWQFDGESIVVRPYKRALRAIDLTPGPPAALPRWVEGDAISVASWRGTNSAIWLRITSIGTRLSHW